MSTINQPRESTVAPISTSYRTSNNAIHDIEAIKKEILTAVRDEIRRDAPQNTPPHRQGSGPTSVGNQNNRYPRRESRGRNLRTTEGQPIRNSCLKVVHVARYCKESGMVNYLSSPAQVQYVPPPPPHAPFHNYQFPPTPPSHFGNNFWNLNDQEPSTWGHRGPRD